MFLSQGDKEKAVGLPASPLMDRSLKDGLTRSQVGYIQALYEMQDIALPVCIAGAAVAVVR